MALSYLRKKTAEKKEREKARKRNVEMSLAKYKLNITHCTCLRKNCIGLIRILEAGELTHWLLSKKQMHRPSFAYFILFAHMHSTITPLFRSVIFPAVRFSYYEIYTISQWALKHICALKHLYRFSVCFLRNLWVPLFT